MSEEKTLTKAEKLFLLVEFGLIEKEEDFSSLTVSQIDILLSNVNKITLESISDEQIQSLLKNNTDQFLKERLIGETVKRRKLEQEVEKMKTIAKNKAQELLSMFQ